MSVYESKSSVTKVIGFSIIGVVVVGIFILYSLTAPKELDRNSLCPINETILNKTILVIDTTDPLTPNNEENLKQLLRFFREAEKEEYFIEVGEELIVYELSSDLADINPIVQVCNPGGNPEDWTWRDDISRGYFHAVKDWKQFESAMLQSFPQRTDVEASQSLILENLSVIMTRHDDGWQRSQDSSTHLIVFSDLLQNSEALSHYEPYGSSKYPPSRELDSAPPFWENRVDLTGVSVSLFRINRARDQQYQNSDHRNWWLNFLIISGAEKDQIIFDPGN